MGPSAAREASSGKWVSADVAPGLPRFPASPIDSTRLCLYSMTAYLVIREGSKWTDVFRLVDGESVTVGRAPTNAIVVKDERCSRNHAEVFQSQGQWMLRDQIGRAHV